MPENTPTTLEQLAANIPQSPYRFMLEKIEDFVADSNPDLSAEELQGQAVDLAEEFFSSHIQLTGEAKLREEHLAVVEGRRPDLTDDVRYNQFMISRAKLGVQDRPMLEEFINAYYKDGSVQEILNVQSEFEAFKDALSREWDVKRDAFLNKNKQGIDKEVKTFLGTQDRPRDDEYVTTLDNDTAGHFSSINRKLSRELLPGVSLSEEEQLSLFEAIRLDVLFAKKVKAFDGEEYWKRPTSKLEKAKVLSGTPEPEPEVYGEIDPADFASPKTKVQVNADDIPVTQPEVEDGVYTSNITKQSYTVSTDRLFEDWKVAYAAKNNKAAEEGYKTPDSIPAIQFGSQLSDTYKESPLIKQARYSEEAMDPANDPSGSSPDKQYDGLTTYVRKINQSPEYYAAKKILEVLNNNYLSDSEKVCRTIGVLEVDELKNATGIANIKELFADTNVSATEKIAQLRTCVKDLSDEQERRVCAARTSMGVISSRVAHFFEACCNGTSALSRTYRAGMLHALYTPVLRDRRPEDVRQADPIKWDQKPLVFTGANQLLLFQDSYDRHDAFLYDPRYLSTDDIDAIQRMKEDTAKLGYPSGDTIALDVDANHRPAVSFYVKQTPVYDRPVMRGGQKYVDKNGNTPTAQDKAKGYNVYGMFNASLLTGIPRYHRYRHQVDIIDDKGNKTGFTTESALPLKTLEKMNKVMLTLAYEQGMINRSKETDGAYRPWQELANRAYSKHPNGVTLYSKNCSIDDYRIQMPSPEQAKELYVSYTPEEGGIKTLPNTKFCSLFIRRLVERADALNELRIQDRNEKNKVDAGEKLTTAQAKQAQIYGFSNGDFKSASKTTARERMDEPIKAIRLELATFLVCQMLSFPYAPEISQSDRDAGINERNYLAKLCQKLIANSVEYGNYKLNAEQKAMIARGELKPDIEWACAVDEALSNFQKNCLDKAAIIQNLVVPRYMYHELGLTGQDMPLLNTPEGQFFAYTTKEIKDFSKDVSENTLQQMKLQLDEMKQEAAIKGSFYSNLAYSLEDVAFKELIKEPVMNAIVKQLEAEKKHGLSDDAIKDSVKTAEELMDAARQVAPERRQPGVKYTGIITNVDDFANTFTMLVTRTDYSQMGVGFGGESKDGAAPPISPMSLTEETAIRLTSPERPRFVDFPLPKRNFVRESNGHVFCKIGDTIRLEPGSAWTASSTKIGVKVERPHELEQTKTSNARLYDVIRAGRRSQANTI